MSELPLLSQSCVMTEEVFDINVMNKDWKSELKHFSVSGVKEIKVSIAWLYC